MKQLSALGARRHAFFRGPRRMRALGGRLEDPDILGPGAYGYYGGKMAGERPGEADTAASSNLESGEISIKRIHRLCFTTLTLKKKQNQKKSESKSAVRLV